MLALSKFHKFRYFDEQSFRDNNRKGLNDRSRFELAMQHVLGKRLTYEQFICAGSATSDG
jgi:hypothetical protein